MKKPNCLHCKHYFSTYDSQSPRGCKLFNFKTAQFPSWVIKRESGKECEGFEYSQGYLKKQKQQKEEKLKDIDLNDDRYW